MSSAVRFAARIPASRDVSSAFPFGSPFFAIKPIVAGDNLTKDSAIARRRVTDFSLTSTIAERQLWSIWARCIPLFLGCMHASWAGTVPQRKVCQKHRLYGLSGSHAVTIGGENHGGIATRKPDDVGGPLPAQRLDGPAVFAASDPGGQECSAPWLLFHVAQQFPLDPRQIGLGEAAQASQGRADEILKCHEGRDWITWKPEDELIAFAGKYGRFSRFHSYPGEEDLESEFLEDVFDEVVFAHRDT